MKKVLIFTYYWPPAGGVAVQRWLKFAKYLPEFGWEPIIITVANGSYPYYDESLLKEVSRSLRVYRTKTFEPFELYNLLRGKKGKSIPAVALGTENDKSVFQKVTEYIRANFFIPDARKGWLPYALRQAKEILNNENIDAIVTTGPPHSTHLIGLEMKKDFKVKWVADFRDPWSKNLINEYLPRTSFAVEKDKKIENSVLGKADRIMVIGAGMKRQFQDRTEKIDIVYNGFDQSDFDVEPILSAGFFTLRHIGNLTLSMNVAALWQAIDEVRKEDEHFRKFFKFEIIGNAHASLRKELEKYDFNSVVHYFGYVNHETAVAYMKGSPCLLFLLSNVPNSDVIISGKIFEYLASRVPILGIGSPLGNVDVLLTECGRKKIIDFADKEKIKRTLKTYFHEWMNGNRNLYEGNEHLNYTRQSQSKRLSKILYQLTV